MILKVKKKTIKIDFIKMIWSWFSHLKEELCNIWISSLANIEKSYRNKKENIFNAQESQDILQVETLE